MKLQHLLPSDHLASRHIGPAQADVEQMLAAMGLADMEALIDTTVPESIRFRGEFSLPEPRGERQLLAALREMVSVNQVARSYIGCGYYGCITPPVILRNILENPGWYTQYTPYQAEISQGRLEALLNFQTMIGDLTGLPLSNASLLDEATAAAEAMAMCWRIARSERGRFFAAADCHPQTLAVLQTRAAPLGMELQIGELAELDLSDPTLCGILLQYPTTDGRVCDYRNIAAAAHASGVQVVVACDLLALALLTPPGEWGADIAVGSSQRFGVPMGFGGPHAAFLAAGEEHKRQIPGRIVGVSRDRAGRVAYRLALQTREQHIRRDRATSNICTAQVLLAVMAGMYGAYHGPTGLRRIAERVRGVTAVLDAGLRAMGLSPDAGAAFFDTLTVALEPAAAAKVRAATSDRRINLRWYEQRPVGGGCGAGISLDETATLADVQDVLDCFASATGTPVRAEQLAAKVTAPIPDAFARTSSFMTHEVFGRYHSEHELLRYMHRLQSRDLSMTTSMIPLGSCTMKLNATSEMLPVTWPEIGALHPLAPAEQTAGYGRLFGDLECWLADLSGFAAVSLQPNAGSQGEYAGLLVIRAYQAGSGRDVCLIPTSAHGTNPASAVMAGFRVVPVACDAQGNIDVVDLKARAEEHADRLAALMVTYPSTHGVFEASIREICDVVHRCGGQVYMDGANMNAQIGLCRPGDIGADVCHINLHKTFCIPHGGGGPGMGPIAVAAHLAPYLPGHEPAARSGARVPDNRGAAVGAVSAAPYGSPSILPISWMYIAAMGAEGLTRASQVAILNANYMAHRLAGAYEVVFRGQGGRVAHEFVLDCRPFKKSAGVEVEDIAKRLMDYGFHAPTMSWPVAGTLMIEPTESESKAELDRADNPLKNAPHTAADICADAWSHPYSRQRAAYPAPWLVEHKYWPTVARIDNAYGDRNLVCSCPPMDAYE